MIGYAPADQSALGPPFSKPVRFWPVNSSSGITVHWPKRRRFAKKGTGVFRFSDQMKNRFSDQMKLIRKSTEKEKSTLCRILSSYR